MVELHPFESQQCMDAIKCVCVCVYACVYKYIIYAQALSYDSCHLLPGIQENIGGQ